MPKAHTRRNLLQVWHCSKGVTAIEYALIAGTVAAILIFSVATVSKHLDKSFRNTATELSGMPGTGSDGGGGGGTSDGGSDGGTAANDDNSGGSDSGGASNDDSGDDDGGRGGGRGRGRGR